MRRERGRGHLGIRTGGLLVGVLALLGSGCGKEAPTALGVSRAALLNGAGAYVATAESTASGSKLSGTTYVQTQNDDGVDEQLAEKGAGHGVPRYDASDVYYLDGNELIPSCTTFGGTHCTRIESYQRVVWDGANNRWVVTARNGTVSTYGKAFITAAGTYQWGLSEVRDTLGNTVTYDWWYDGTDQCYPRSVTYNGDVAILVYLEGRTDVASHARGSAGLGYTRYRLKSIDVKVGGARARAYALGYLPSTNTQRSWLASVTQYGTNAAVNENDGTVTGASHLPALTLATQAGSTALNTAWSVAGWTNAAGWSVENRYATIHYTDVNGDGKADVCYRDANGIACRAGTGTGFGAEFRGPALTDAAGWTAPQYYKTIQHPDVNGDGKADVCARDGSGVVCWPSTGAGFGASFRGPAWSDAAGWNVVQHYSTIRFADLDGDGKADVCGRDAQGIMCCLNTGSSFDACFRGPDWPEAAGCGLEEYYSSFQYPDLNGDGKADLCGRDSTGVLCWLGTGQGFGSMFAGPAWATASGWEYAKYNATIQYPDLNGDGRADICARDSAGIQCWLGTGQGFVNQFRGPAWTDASGWGAHQYYSTIQFPDLNGDGLADICARAGAGITCYFGTGAGFANAIAGPAWSDAAGWNQHMYYSTIRFRDLNGDGKADVIARNSVSLTATNANLAPGAGDLLASISNGIGGVSTITYKSSNTWPNAQLPLGLAFPMVASVSVDDGRGDTQATTYTYEGAKWDAANREFLGFRKATTTIGATGAYSETYYWQRVGTIGKPEAIYKRNLGGAIMTFDKYTFCENGTPNPCYAGAPAGPPYSSLMTEMWSFECNGDAVVDANHNYVSGCRRRLGTYAWDQYANLIEERQYGDCPAGNGACDANGDERTAVRGFVPNTSAYIVGMPAYEEMRAGIGASGTLLARTRFFYDDATAESTAPTHGLVTKKGTWNDQTGGYAEYAYGYDAYGNQTSLTDPLGRTGYKTYDPTYHMAVTSSTDELGYVTQTAWDLVLGVPLTETDVNGNQTTHAYDVFGRGTFSTMADGSQVKVEHLDYGNPNLQRIRTSKLITGGTWVWDEGYFDGAGRDYKGVSSTGVTQIKEYGTSGKVSKQSLPYAGGETVRYDVFTYDEMGRQLAVTMADGVVVRQSYDDGSASATDAMGNVRTEWVDAYRRVVKVREVIDGTAHDSDFAYDLLGRRTWARDAVGAVTTASYSSLGWVLQRSDPDQGVWSYQYDAVGRLTRETDALGHATTVGYDVVGRVTQRTYADGSHDDYVFDEAEHGAAKGRLTTATSASGAVTRMYYDVMGRRTRYEQTLDGTTRAIGHTFDVAGRVAAVTYPDGEVVTYGYGTSGLQLGRLVTVTGSVAGALVTNVTYTSQGKVAAVTYANGVTTTTTYTGTGQRVARLQLGSFGTIDYGYDPNGRVTAMTSAAFASTNWGYGYDSLGRLTKATNLTDGAYSQTFAYDAVGRMVCNSKKGAYIYADPNHPHAVTAAGADTYAYDANGNLIAGGGRVLTYNLDHRPASITYDGHTTSFVHDALGARVKKTGPSGTVRYVGALHEERGEAVTNYYFAGAARVARRNGTAVTYFHTDHLGSTRLLTNASGQEVQYYDYTPYGRTMVATGTAPDSHRFTGQATDDETGLVHFNARYYDPTLGRFVQPDSLLPRASSPQELDPYTYALNSPINYVDPSGHAPLVAVVVAAVAWCAEHYIIATIIGTALTFTNNPVLQTIGMIMTGAASAGMWSIPGLGGLTGPQLGALVALAQSPISPLDPTIKKVIGWAYTLHGTINTLNLTANGGEVNFGLFKASIDVTKNAFVNYAKAFLLVTAKELFTTAIGWAVAYAASSWSTAARYAIAFIGRAFVMSAQAYGGPMAMLGATYDLVYTLKYPDGRVYDLSGGDPNSERFVFYYHTGFNSPGSSLGRQHIRVWDEELGGYWEIGDAKAGFLGPGLGWGGWVATQKITVILSQDQAAAFRAALTGAAAAGGRYEGYHNDSYVYVSFALFSATGYSAADLHINPGLLHW